MKDKIVTIKIPEKMLSDLRKAAYDRNFIDISEEVRSVIRQKWLMYNDLRIMKVKKLKDEIKVEVEKKSQSIAREKVINELEDIKKKVQKSW